jgi:hypothetical protein
VTGFPLKAQGEGLMNVCVILLSAAAMMTLALLAASPSSKVESVPGEYMEVVSFDTGVERSKAPLPSDESARFNHYNPVIRWASSRDAVEYLVVGNPKGVKSDAVDSAVATLDKEIDSRRFKRTSKSKQKNPCTGESTRSRGSLGMARVVFWPLRVFATTRRPTRLPGSESYSTHWRTGLPKGRPMPLTSRAYWPTRWGMSPGWTT